MCHPTSGFRSSRAPASSFAPRERVLRGGTTVRVTRCQRPERLRNGIAVAIVWAPCRLCERVPAHIAVSRPGCPAGLHAAVVLALETLPNTVFGETGCRLRGGVSVGSPGLPSPSVVSGEARLFCTPYELDSRP